MTPTRSTTMPDRPLDPVAETMAYALVRLMGEDATRAFEIDTSESERDLRAGMILDGMFMIDRLRERGFVVVPIFPTQPQDP